MKCWNRKRKPKHTTKSKYHKRSNIYWNRCRDMKHKYNLRPYVNYKGQRHIVLNRNFTNLKKLKMVK